MRISLPGNCAEAVAFYCDAFGIEARNVFTFGERQDALGEVPAAKAGLIYQAELDLPGSPGMRLLLNDTPVLLFNDNPGLIMQQPDIEVEDANPDVIRNLYEKLMRGGKSNKLLAEAPPYLLHGSMIDAYGICWHLRCKE